MELLETLKDRNVVLFWFGLANASLFVMLLLASFLKPVEFMGTSAWDKPMKFALSIAILAWTMAWYTGYLPPGKDIQWFNWIFVATLAFEVLYIAFQAARGQASHFNVSTPLYTVLYSLMALAASIASLGVGYIGLKFFTSSLPDLPDYYLWAIRLGIILFVIFSFQGFAMGSRLSHTVGGEDGGIGIPFLNWSLSQGDLRIAHFVGMHALQVLPLLAWFILKDVKWTLGFFAMYSFLAVFLFWQALRGSSFMQFQGS